MPIENLEVDWQYTKNGIKNLVGNAGKRIARFDICKGQTLKLGFKLLTDVVKDTSFTVSINGKGDNSISFIGIHTFSINKIYEKSYVATADTSVSITMWGNADSEIFEFQLWAEIDELTDYKQHEQTDHILNIQQEMLEGDYFVKEEDGWKEVHCNPKITLTGTEENWTNTYGTNLFNIQNFLPDIVQTEYKALCNRFKYNSIQSGINDATIDGEFAIQLRSTGYKGNIFFKNENFSNVDGWKLWLQQLYNAGNPVYVYYKTENPTKLACTEEQSAVLEELNNLELFKGTNNIITTEDIALLKLNYIADTKIYVDNKYNQLANQILEIVGGN